MSRTRLPQPNDRLTIGHGGLQASPICLGRVPLAGDPDTVLAAYDLGINFFFVTADLHWPIYEHLREGLRRLVARGSDIRDRIIIAGVSYAPRFAGGAWHDLMRGFPELERLDILALGGLDSGSTAASLDLPRRLVERNVFGARAVAASFHDRKLALELTNRGVVDIGFIRCNPAHPGAREEILPHRDPDAHTRLYNFQSTYGAITAEHCERLGLDKDYWYPTITDYYRFALSSPAMDGALVKFQNVEQLEQLSIALANGPLSVEEQNYLIDLARLTKDFRPPYVNPDDVLLPLQTAEAVSSS